jgi:hypothetical protein
MLHLMAYPEPHQLAHSLPEKLTPNRGLEVDCIRVVKETIAKLGSLDIIISNAVRSPLAIFSF